MNPNEQGEVKRIKEMTEEQLRSHLITCDYLGKTFKTLVLDELLNRKSFDERGRHGFVL